MSYPIIDAKDVDMELVYTALIGYPDDEDAAKFMAARDYQVSAAKMGAFRRRCENPTSPMAEPFQRARAQMAPLIEAKLADDMLTNASRATMLEGACFDRIAQKLKQNEIHDPARVARDLSQIRTQAIDKRLALQGRPTTITANRSMEEIVRQLESMNVVKRVDAEGDAIELELEA